MLLASRFVLHQGGGKKAWDLKRAPTCGQGVSKVRYEKETKVPNAGTFTIEREDHTLGNLVRMYALGLLPALFSPSPPPHRQHFLERSRQLLRDSQVKFAGYQIPHPLEYQLYIRVHTFNESSPPEALRSSLSQLSTEVDTIKESLSVRPSKPAACFSRCKAKASPF